MGFYTATEVPYNDVIYRLVCIFIYIYVLLYVLQIQYVREYIHTIQARERASERDTTYYYPVANGAY